MQLTQFSRVEWPRAAIRQGLLDSSVPATNVDEITDLAIQATNQASAAAFRTLDAASDLRNQLCAFGVAFSLLRNFAARMIENRLRYSSFAAPQPGWLTTVLLFPVHGRRAVIGMRRAFLVRRPIVATTTIVLANQPIISV